MPKLQRPSARIEEAPTEASSSTDSELVDLMGLWLGLDEGADGDNAALMLRAAHAWPWLKLFSQGDRATFLAEFGATLAACTAVNELEPLQVLLRQWRNTASAIAAGVDLRSPVTDDDAVVVERPSS